MALSTDAAGFLLAGSIAAALIVAVTLRERWTRWWFEFEDPRTIALFRIVFAFLLLWNILGLNDWFEYLFTPDGLLSGAAARDAFVGGWTGPFSILYFWDAGFPVVLGAFVVATALFMAGLWTRPAGVVTLALYDTLLCRNPVFWEGTEFVLRVFLVYLVCARCGHAYSVDEWRRRRREGFGSPRPIPAWPRRMMMFQAAVLLATTGLLKHGDAWITGDAVYYALTYEHFARFRIEAGLAAIDGPVLTAVTWLSRSAEVFFPLALVGVVGRWSAQHFPPLQGRRRRVAGLALLVGLTCSTLVVHATGAPRLLPVAVPEIAAPAWAVVLGATWWAWTGPRRLARAIYGRRIWLTAVALLMLGMWMLMNIGVFHPVMLATLLVYFDGSEVGRGLAWLRGSDAPPETALPGDLAYGPHVRRVGGILIGWHIVAIGIAVLPAAPETAALRDRVGLLAGPWLAATRTTQAWGMWSKPPHENVFLKLVVVDAMGDAWDLRTDLYASELRPPNPLGYDRWWKIAERIVKSSATQPWQLAQARYVCRTWHGGGAAAILRGAASVEIREVKVPIPTAAENRRIGGYNPDHELALHSVERVLRVHPCDDR